jgi:hypothetical protein
MLRFHIPLIVGAALLGLALPASAGPGELGEGRFFDYGPDEGPPLVTESSAAPTLPRGGEQQTIFINFDGATLTHSMWDYAPDNQTQFPDAAGDYPAHGSEPGSQLRQAVIDAVKVHYAPFAIDVTDTRPEHIHHNMILVSPKGKSAGKLGFASLNCGLANPTGVGFAFYTSSDGAAPVEMASTISHEAAHTFGIEHSTDTADLMYPTYTASADAFMDQCAPVDGAEYCGDAHRELCPDGGQNTYGELYAYFGMGAPDGGGPQVEIVEPADRTHFEIGEVVDVLVEATDDLSVSQVRLYRDGSLLGTDLGDPFEWDVDGLDEGIYELHAVAIDAAGNEAASDPITIAVGDVELPPDDDGEADTGTEGGLDPDLGADEVGEEGCGCRSTGAEGRAELLLLLPLLGLRRRRR